MASEISLSNLDENEIVFPNLGFDFHINPTAFHIGNLDVQWYGLLITIGMVLAIIYAFTQLKHYGLCADRFIDCVLGGVIGAIIGARLYYVVLNWQEYSSFSEILNYRNGGLAVYGGIIGGIVLGGIIAALRKVKLMPALDITAIGLLLGQGIGRWGNFVNQEAFGTNTDSLFAMSGDRIQSWINNSYTGTSYYENFGTTLDATQGVHPCFLYESAWCLLGFVLLAIFAKKIRKFDGQIFLMYIGWYGLERAVVESFRTDSLVIGNVRVSQLLAILCVVASVVLLLVIGSKVRREGSDYVLYCNTAEGKLMVNGTPEEIKAYFYEQKHGKIEKVADEESETTAKTDEKAEDEKSETESTEASEKSEEKTEETEETEENFEIQASVNNDKNAEAVENTKKDEEKE